MDNKGVTVDYAELVKQTIQGVLDIVEKEGKFEKCMGDRYRMTFKDGCDGAGQQVVMNSVAMLGGKENMFLYGLVPLKLVATRVSGEEVVVWENTAPNSSKSLRPVYLIRAAETDAKLLDEVIGTTDSVRKNLEEENQMFSFKGEEVIIQLEIRDSMKDLKLKRKISGLGGADCILCVSKQNDWTDPASIHEGFPITRESDETFRLFLKLVDKNGIVPRETGDF